MCSRGYPHTPARHNEGHVLVLLRNANSFVIILIYAPVSRRATHRRRRSTDNDDDDDDDDDGGDGGGFVYTLLACAPEISFPAFLQSADVYAMLDRDVSGGFVWSERAGRAALLVTCASTEVYTPPRRHATLSHACRAIMLY